MLKLSKKMEYALIALKYISGKPPESVTSTKEICLKFNTPFDTMAKVLQNLQTNGILFAQQGIKGGYILGRSLSEVSMAQLFQMIDGMKAPVECMSGEKFSCEQSGTCNIIGPLQKLIHQIQHYLATLSVAELFDVAQSERLLNAPLNQEQAL